jgi:hypothetical protein
VWSFGNGTGDGGGFLGVNFLAWWSGVFAGFFAKTVCRAWFFAGEIVVDAW